MASVAPTPPTGTTMLLTLKSFREAGTAEAKNSDLYPPKAASMQEMVHAIKRVAMRRNYQMLPATWDDVKRDQAANGEPSPWGENICDVRAISEQHETLYVLRDQNLNGGLGLISLKEFAVVIGNERRDNKYPPDERQSCTLYDLLKTAGMVSHAVGLDPNTDLTNDEAENENATIRIQTIFLPIPGKKSAEESAEESKSYHLTTYNRQTLSKNDPQNLLYLCNSQGSSAHQDEPGITHLYHHEVDPEGIVHQYLLEGAQSTQGVGLDQTETQAEALKAAARGQATLRCFGTKEMGQRFDVQAFVQIPLIQKPKIYPYIPVMQKPKIYPYIGQTGGGSNEPLMSYTGETGEDNKPHGTGKMEFDDGSTYEGGFRKGAFHGVGTFTAAGGRQVKIKGRFEENECKDGVCSKCQDVVFGRMWKLTKHAAHCSPDISQIGGEPIKVFNVNGVFVTTGTRGIGCSRTYDGHLNESKLPHGWGIMKWPDGSLYEGECREGSFKGRGIFYVPNGRTFFEGLWDKNQAKDCPCSRCGRPVSGPRDDLLDHATKCVASGPAPAIGRLAGCAPPNNTARIGTSNAARVSRGKEVPPFTGYRLTHTKPVRDKTKKVTITVTRFVTVANGVPSPDVVEEVMNVMDYWKMSCNTKPLSQHDTTVFAPNNKAGKPYDPPPIKPADPNDKFPLPKT